MALKLQIVSDLHLSQAGFTLPPTDADAVVLAGDIARPREAVAWARGVGKPVFYVPGNHEFYGASLDGTRAQLHALCEGSDIQVLDDRCAELAGVRIVGSTLWTDFELFDEGPERTNSVEAAMRFMRDFQRIRVREDAERLFTPADCAQQFRQHAAWLQRTLATPHPGPTVVITHHAPSPRSVHARFAGSPVNACFVSRAEHLLGGDRAVLWVHGHTHDSFDYDVAGTRVVCNPRGYVRDGVAENAAFDPALVIAIG